MHEVHAEPQGTGTGTRVAIKADSVLVAGDILCALARHLGITELPCISEFPDQMALAQQVLRDAAEGTALACQMQADAADMVNSVKALVRIRAIHAVFPALLSLQSSSKAPRSSCLHCGTIPSCPLAHGSWYARQHVRTLRCLCSLSEQRIRGCCTTQCQ
jgi:hypothetical protein